MDSSTKTVAATAFAVPIGLLLFVLMIVGTDPAVSCATPLPAGAAAGASGPTGHSVAGLSEAQLRLARNGVAVGRQRGMSESVIIAELAAQATESTFRNLANPAVPESLRYANDGLGYDHDSVGPHQIRVSIHGAVGIAALMDPIYQINWFYDQAERLGARAQQMSPAELAQAIEVSGPNAYASHLDLARRLYAMFAGIEVGSMPRTEPGAAAGGCGPGGPGTPMPVTGSGFGRAVIEHAARWMGTPYVWGGGDSTGPTMGGFDCSGLTLYAIYQASGGQIRLPHYTQAQQDHPSAQQIPFGQKAPGDLIFFTAAPGSDSHHVGIYYGRDEQGSDLVLHAPQTGQTVTLTPLSAWQGEHIDIRRYQPPTPAPGKA
ncbi:C40 family peptidase [Nocardia brasiliensis]|uniref:C40 family peptidase n=1 Tax=Nocardia brasiliensis TaxID=37326 RepID=UPI001E2E19CF|nr:C40 family peptidase [Nocardia brasiliensis]